LFLRIRYAFSFLDLTMETNEQTVTETDPENKVKD